jgi:hypothetical protein
MLRCFVTTAFEVVVPMVDGGVVTWRGFTDTVTSQGSVFWRILKPSLLLKTAIL